MDLNDSVRQMVADEEHMQRYRVNEIFHSVQGEGFHTGVPSTFIRLQGCPVGCPWCDTKYTWPSEAAQGKKLGESMTADQIAATIQHPHVVITGGEPTLWDLDDLIYAVGHIFPGVENTVQLESSGLCDFRGSILPQWVTWSPKRNLDFDAPEGFKIAVDEIKFVVDDEIRLADVEKVLSWYRDYKALNLGLKVLTFMAEGCPPTSESLQKAQTYAIEFNGYPERVMISDRLQYRAGVR